MRETIKQETIRSMNIQKYGLKKICKCGNRNIIFYDPKQEKKLCTWCGNYVYRNSYIEFRERLEKVLRYGK